MKKLVLFTVLSVTLIITDICYAQNRAIDSLLKHLSALKEDTNKVNLLNHLGREYLLISEFPASRRYSSEAQSISKKINYNKGKAIALLNYGKTHYLQGNYPAALQKYDTVLSICRTLNDKSVAGICYNNIGMVYGHQGKYSDALTCFSTAMKYNKEAGNETGTGDTYSNIGSIYAEQGKFPEALQHYFSSLKIAEKQNDKAAIGTAHFNIGYVYDNQSMVDTAMKIYGKALELFQQSGDKKGIAKCYSNIANNYFRRDSLVQAMDFNKRAYKIFEGIGDRVWTAYIKTSIAQIKARQGNITQALEDYFSSLLVFEEIKDTLNLVSSYYDIGGIYYGHGLYKEAANNYQKALLLAKAIGAGIGISFSYEGLALAYEKMGDYKNAYANYKLYTAMNDSMFNETKSSQIAEMKTRYETEKKDNEITLLGKNKKIREAEIKKQKLLKFAFIGGMGTIILLLLFGYRSYRTRQVQRLQVIRNKIAGDLHDDIGSTLNSISIYSEVARRKGDQQDEALEMIGEASRKIIDAMSDIVWTINPDNDNFGKIIFRMKSLAYNLFRAKKIEYSFYADDALDSKKLSLEDRRNLYLVFKESINNLVKYSNATNVDITLINDKDFIKLHIKDNGVGFNTSQENTGNGLKNMKRRADEMKASYRLESAIGKGTEIELILKA
jgi:two-component system, NarL family, sensor histidine kinase UhpB